MFACSANICLSLGVVVLRYSYFLISITQKILVWDQNYEYVTVGSYENDDDGLKHT